jgi:UDP-N-acetyl-D-mannosaminuronate dehydrogenase
MKKHLKPHPLVVGLGQVGEALFEAVRGVYPDAERLDLEPVEVKGPVNVLHLCFPDSDDYVLKAVEYITRFKPQLTLVESTVRPNTISRIYEQTQAPICHSPHRGNIKDGMKWGLFTYTKYVGPAKPDYAKAAVEYYASLGLKVKVFKSSLETELAKLLETTYYGVLIAWFQDVHRICEWLGAEEKEVVDLLGAPTLESGGLHLRPIFYPSFIGGHCVIPNAQIIRTTLQSLGKESLFVNALLESNKQRATELNL